MRLLATLYVVVLSLSWIGASPLVISSDVSIFSPISLVDSFNNRGIGSPGSTANLDGLGSAFPEQDVRNAGLVRVGTLAYQLITSGNDNVAAFGQDIPMTPRRYGALYLLVTATHGPSVGNLTAVYSDGTSDTTKFVVSDWQTGGAYSAFSTATIVQGRSIVQSHGHMYSLPVYVNPAKTLVNLSLPAGGPVASFRPLLHIFAAAGKTASSATDLAVTHAVATANKIPDKSGRLWQMVEVDVHNSGSKRLYGSNVKVSVLGHGVVTRVPGVLDVLEGGEKRTVYIGVATSFTGKRQLSTALSIKGSNIAIVTMNIPLQLGINAWEPNEASLSQHKAPRWFDQDKFGIFIHWGLYSVPAWGPPGGMYSEWYWSNYNHPQDETYEYHAKTWGKHFEYDDFIPLFNPHQFNPREWLDLITESGANYFVLTSKHHEGIALWDTKVSNRSFVALGPKRNFVNEVLEVAEKEYGHLKAGLYFSMPEWYNPAYPTTGAFGHTPRNAYTGAAVPYTGSPDFKDYVNELQLPQLLELVDLKFDLKIIWCDIGGVNNSTFFAAKFFNNAVARNQEVTINDRCGMRANDFSTPEYSTLAVTSRDKWETTRGIDPHSFGYNQGTKPDQYANASSMVQLLVDSVSKGGNLLLDIGPDAQGRISEPQQASLRGIGAWLAVNGKAIYNTTYWWVTSDEGDLRFTSAVDAFYITSLKRPAHTLQITSPIPISPGDIIEHIGSPCAELAWSRGSDNVISISVPSHCIHTVADVEAWVFKVVWKQDYIPLGPVVGPVVAQPKLETYQAAS
ncbi:glycoside hydrolase superfamily [Umbelopsis sp. AD052]|nr:glycoside hydrolase superfamily [Umbelopsis sp. AD052]